LRGNLLCKREQSETQFQLCRVQPALDEVKSQPCVSKVSVAAFDRTTAPLSLLAKV